MEAIKKKNDRMNSEMYRKNQGLMRGWTIIGTVLFLAYVLEVVKKSRTIPYFLVFSLILLVPLAAAHILYRKNPENKVLHVVAAFGYTGLYVFVLLTGKTVMTFSYILPMMFIFMSLNNTKLIARVGVVVTLANFLSVAYAALTNPNFAAESAAYEIQIAATLLCTFFSYMSVKVSNGIYQLRSDKILETEKKQETIIEQIGEVSVTVKNDTDQMVDSLRDLRDASDRTQNAMEEVVGGMRNANEMIEVQLSKTSEIQDSIQTAEQLTASIQEMVGKTKMMVGDGRENMQQLMVSAENVENGSKQVSEHMGLLQNMTVEMKEIIDIISSIANQTNLLALNASIEAARAGEAGRGFSVVAEQITKLASQTKQATENITGMVNALSEKASEANGVVDNMAMLTHKQNEIIRGTEHMFTEIATDVSQVQEHVSSQEDCMKVLVASNTEIVESVHTVSAISQEVMASSQQTQEIAKNNTRIVQEVNVLADNLSKQTDSLYEYAK